MTSNTVNIEQGEWGGIDKTPPLFFICCSILKRFFFQWKGFHLLVKMRYLWVMALLGACDVTKHGCHLGCDLGFYPIGNFLCLTCKMTHKLVLCFILSTDFVFIVKKGWKHTLIFTEKWLNHPLLMTSYLVTIVTVHHQTYLKMCVKDKRTVTDNVRWSCLIV